MNVADDWILTRALRYWKRPICQLWRNQWTLFLIRYKSSLREFFIYFLTFLTEGGRSRAKTKSSSLLGSALGRKFASKKPVHDRRRGQVVSVPSSYSDDPSSNPAKVIYVKQVAWKRQKGHNRDSMVGPLTLKVLVSPYNLAPVWACNEPSAN